MNVIVKEFSPRKAEKAFDDYTDEQLQEAFKKLVKAGKHWKDPIYVTIDKADFNICNAAACYITGGPIEVRKELKNGKIKVYGEGYYNNIGM